MHVGVRVHVCNRVRVSVFMCAPCEGGGGGGGGGARAPPRPAYPPGPPPPPRLKVLCVPK